ncbi:MAG: ATP-dependent Clp protease adaptor ClpS [Phocaeicola sp.]|uniref:ATP-dependent Clp protease adaptor ClpS n=1 Tax=Phocaeicola sp. TaxID=2773926 RepID=UPI0023CD2226|nr:ATP-dependent Clp protease adaptor ClpS [Phocaeicola sp.]MDE5678078.1 ATP-dependent Clp protease adaptor ClpS [Phocaeicola sp.]MDE6179677.1 ATP-dependent Clp protease adaptor ClpS [Phocaeicola sp.]
MEQQQSFYKEREHIDLKEPRRFKVTIFNDDFTTMEFVVKILTTVFFKSETEAESLMMLVHRTKSAVVGVYTYDIAQSKVQKATRMAQNEGFPLRLTATPEGK